ncbi:Crp/Fnr family transcriptional regulator [Rhodoferax sp. 4810]|nr:Crp/Fnr family transcriptional regulator [Rhodoferax jenense]
MHSENPDLPARPLAAREPFAPEAAQLLWRVHTGVLRIDSAPGGEASRFVRLALPGDVIGIERWAGTHEALSQRAVIASQLVPVAADGAEMMQILMESVVVAHQRCREVVTLRTGPAAQRIQALLLMFAQSGAVPGAPAGLAPQDFAVPHLADLSDILDVAPETVSRVFGSMRAGDFLAARRPQKARLSRQALRALEQVVSLPGALAGPRLQAHSA